MKKSEEVEHIVSRFQNLDLNTVITPVKVDRLKELLVKSNYDPAETAFLVTGFSQGFDIGYRGPTNR